MKIEIEKVLQQLRTEITGLAKNSFKKYQAEAKKDVVKFNNSFHSNAKRWTQLRSENKLTQNEFEFLIMSFISSAQMTALRHAGVSYRRVQKFRDQIFDIVTSVFQIKVIDF